MKKMALFFTALLLVLPAPASGGAFEAEAVYVIDGDTFQFEVGLINVVIRGRCRMLRYNAPELTGPELTEKERQEGTRAKDKLRELIEDKRVRIESDETDKYGRWLCEVWLPDGTNVNGVMREFLKDYRGRDKYLDKAPGRGRPLPRVAGLQP
jgi:endonuclease YncB( thermonuclease family)